MWVSIICGLLFTFLTNWLITNCVGWLEGCDDVIVQSLVMIIVPGLVLMSPLPSYMLQKVCICESSVFGQNWSCSQAPPTYTWKNIQRKLGGGAWWTLSCVCDVRVDVWRHDKVDVLLELGQSNYDIHSKSSYLCLVPFVTHLAGLLQAGMALLLLTSCSFR